MSDGRAMWSADAVAIDTSSAVVDVGTLNMKPVRVAAFASDRDCGGQRVSIGQSGGVTRLVIGGESFDLRPVAGVGGEDRLAHAEGAVGLAGQHAVGVGRRRIHCQPRQAACGTHVHYGRGPCVDIRVWSGQAFRGTGCIGVTIAGIRYSSAPPVSSDHSNPII